MISRRRFTGMISIRSAISKTNVRQDKVLKRKKIVIQLEVP